jgi:lipopolysaccharide/colanic/teichoic acid biosynthesis glycosyltransferase
MPVTLIHTDVQFSSRSLVLKRIFDLICVIPGLIILSPLFLVIACGIKLTDNGPVFFKQERVGYKGRTFTILKFRTMVVEAEKIGGQLTVGKDSRITGVGFLLRKTKLDELPQIINVLKGEMSLVGPRPEVPKYASLYSDTQRRVLDIMPGITDPASIEYRNENEVLAGADDPERVYIQEIMPEKIRINLEYARNASILNDISVILRTLSAILK